MSFSKLFIFDSSTIRLFSDIMKGVGRNPKNQGRKKGGLKVHMMIDAHSDTPEFVKISEAKQRDKNFLQYLNLAAHSMIVFDRAYNHYLQFARWTEQNINFVCRLKKNAVYQVQEVLFSQESGDETGSRVFRKKNTFIFLIRKTSSKSPYVYEKQLTEMIKSVSMSLLAITSK